MSQFDPLDNQLWKGYYKGQKLTIPRLGLCEFYRYNKKIDRVEVFDRFGVLRKVSEQELPNHE